MKFLEVAGRRSQVAGLIGKGGQIGEGIVMIYRLLIVTIIAFVVFSVSSVFYDYEIDVRDAEAIILGREVFDCLAPAGVLDLDAIPEEDYDEIVSYCGISSEDRFYVGAKIKWQDAGGRMQVAELYEGDSGALWIRDLYGKVVSTGNSIVGSEGIGKYEPGYLESEYTVFVLKNGVKAKGRVEMEVLVNYEE